MSVTDNSIDPNAGARVLGRVAAVQIPNDDLSDVGGGEANETFTGIGRRNSGPPRPDDCATN